MRKKVIDAVAMAGRFDFLDDSMFEGNPTRIYKWFQYFDEEERKEVIENVMKFENEEIK